MIRKLDSPRKSKIPIVALSASAFEEEKKAAYEAGVNGHIAKPIDFGELLDLISKLLK